MVVEAQEIKTELISLRQELRRLADKVDRLVIQPRHIPDPAYPNIVQIDGVQGSEPMIHDKFVPVSTIVALIQYGQTAEEIVSDYDGRLTPADVYGALSYYYAHREEINHYLSVHQAAREQVRRWSVKGRS